jgi:hypothetical protein
MTSEREVGKLTVEVAVLRSIVKRQFLHSKVSLKPSNIRRAVGNLAQETGVEKGLLRRTLKPVVTEILAEANGVFTG